MTAEEKIPALELRGLTKTFAGKVRACDHIDLSVHRGEILAVLGENGSGKTTLMNMIAGIYFPDEGHILVDGKPAIIASPKDAHGYKIGMIHQHFKLVEVFTAAENIVLGDGGRQTAGKAAARKKVREIAERYSFPIDPDKRVYEMSVSEKQTVEIVKVLYRGEEILILDEPTAVLTPQEIEKLFTVLREMKKDGKAIIIITHKLHEVMELSDRVAVLRKGMLVGTLRTCDTSEKELTDYMVGRKIDLNIERPLPENPVKRLEVRGLTVTNPEGVDVLSDVSFTAYGGEILGIAGIAGSGQRELLETIAGLSRPRAGGIDYDDPHSGKTVDLRAKTPAQIRDLGVRLSFVPEDRLGMGLVGNMDITDNMMLRSYRKGRSLFVDRNDPKKLADRIIDSLKVSTPGTSTPVRRLSGGNVQKVLVGREIALAPTVLMAAYPVRGLDINSSYMIYDLLNGQKKNGVAVIFVGEDLDVLTELCDRILVLSSGRVSGVLDGRTADKETIGRLMTAGGAPRSGVGQEPAGTGAKENTGKGAGECAGTGAKESDETQVGACALQTEKEDAQ